MNFLAPLFLAGAAAIALPILLHLIRRTERARIPFSSLMFLKQTPPTVTRRSRLENLLLLLLRCLAFALIALAFSRPYFQQAMTAATPVTERRRTVVLIDTSASMRREPLWSDALAAARKAFEQPVDELAVVAFDRQPRVVFGFQQWTAAPSGNRAATALGVLEDVKPGWTGTHLGNALVRAVEMLEEGTDLPTRRRIVLISDLQEGASLDGLQGFDWPEGVEVELVALQPSALGNASLQPIADSSTATATGPATALKVRLHNAVDSKTDQFKLRLEGDPQAVDAYVPAGQSRVATLVLTNRVASTNGSGKAVVLTGDAQPFDDQLFLQPESQERLKVVYLGDDDPKDSAGQLYYLLRAFPESRQRRVEVVRIPLNQPLVAAELQQAAMIVVGGVLGEAQSRTVKAVMETGATVLCPMVSPASAAEVGALLGQELPASAENGTRYGLLGQIDFQHPLFAPFADARFSDFTGIHFWKYRKLDLSSIPSANLLAKFDTGEPALAQIPVGSGTLLVLGSTWRPADSQLALSSKFVPLLGGMLELGRTRAPLATQFAVGDTVPLPTNGVGAVGLSVTLPDGKTMALGAGASRFLATDQPGFYRVEGADKVYAFAVNLPPEESRTAPMAADVLPNLGVPVKAPTSTSVQRSGSTSQTTLAAVELESRQKVWRWLIFGALGVVVLETWVAGRLSRVTPATA
jgi:hypothetical protein